MEHLLPALNERRELALYRQRRTVVSHSATEISMDGRRCINFASNDYLGLTHHEAVKQAAIDATGRFGVGSGASHLVSGHQCLHQALEEALARFLGREQALLFSTGYMANLGTIAALCQRHELVLQDKLNHASLIDGAMQGGVKSYRYLHANTESLERKLHKHQPQSALIITDGVFSMDGDMAPLTDICRLAKQYRASVMVDDAHGLGVLGGSGRGVLEHFDLTTNDVPILMGTLGKALGVFGAFVAGSSTLIDFLIQFARPYIYTTALPPGVAAAALTSLEVLQQEPERQRQLRSNIEYFKNRAKTLALPINASETAIQPLIIGDNNRALRLSEQLQQAGYLVTAIRPPTVPRGSARLRITLSAAHQPEQIDQLLDTIQQLHGPQ